MTALPTQRLEGLVARARRERGVPGIAAAAVVDGEIRWFMGAGWADLETTQPPHPRSLARVASVTKPFTATAIYQLRDRRLLSLRDPLAKHLPEFAGVAERGGARDDVTLAGLLTHRSGLVTESPLVAWDRPSFPTMPEILAALPQTEVVIPLDTDWKYSNLGFALLGEVVARHSGETYEEYVAGHIFEPLGMTDSAYALGEERRRLAMTGYLPGINEDRPRLAPTTSLAGLGAAGQLYSNVHDLARWIAFQTGSHPNGASVLSPETLAESHVVRHVQPDWLLGQTAGWRVVRRGERLFHNHGGSVHGFNSSVAFHLPTGAGVVVLANLWPAAVATPLAMDLLDSIVDALPESIGADAPPVPAPAALRPLLGRYRAEPGIAADVVWQHGVLRMVAPAGEVDLHAPVELEPVEGSATTFRLATARAAGELATFADEAGRPSFTIGGFTYRRSG